MCCAIGISFEMSRTKQAARKGKGGARPRAVIAAKKAKNVRKVENDSSENEETTVAVNPPRPQKQVEIPEDNDDNHSSGAESTPEANAIHVKRDRDEFESDNEPVTSPPSKKKKYKSKAERKAAASKPTDSEESGAGDKSDPDMAQMDPSLLADHFAKTIKRCYKKDTTLELDEKYLPSSTFADTTRFKGNRKKEMLGTFLEFVVAGDRSTLTRAAKETARPHTLVLCQSGIRAADLARVLRTYETEGNAVVKLFAKHFKIEQQAVFLRKNKTGFGVGTPQRIRELIFTGGLKLDNLARIVIDGSYLDEKQFGIWGYPDIFKAMLSIVKMETVQERIESGDLKVLVF